MARMYPPPSLTFSRKDNKRIIYICGPHGVGKSTLLNDIKSSNGQVREQLFHHEALQEQVTRQLWRAALHCIEHRENLSYVHTLPPKAVVVGDRCFLDDLAYVRAFEKIKWMTPTECRNVLSMTEDIYIKTGTPKPESFIILLPPLEWNISRIEERWTNGEEPKWCELNFNYLSAVRGQFSKIAEEVKNALLIEATDRLKRINKVKEWLNKHDYEDFIIEGETLVESPKGTGS